MLSRKLLSTAALCFLPVSAMASKSEGIHKFWIDKTYENTSKVENYRAQVSQTSSGTPIVTQVQFRKPADFYMQIDQPEYLRGVTFSFQDNQLIFYSPAENQLLAIKGLAQTNNDSAKQQTEDMYWANHEYYERTFTPSVDVADRISVGIDLDAQDSGRELQKSKLFIDYDYSLLMKGDFYFRDGSVLSLENKSIEFNDENFLLSKPDSSPTATQLSWNLNQQGISAGQLKKTISFSPAWPDVDLRRWQLEQPSYHVSEQGHEAVAMHYQNEHYFLLVTADRRSQGDLTAGATIGLDNEIQGRLLQSPSLNSIQLQRAGVRYQLFSNIHLEDLLAIARQMSN